MTDDVSAEGGEIDAAEQRHAVRERYSDIATEGSSSSCCDGDVDAAGDTGGSTACCGDTAPESMTPEDESRRLGYDEDDIDAVASGANLGLGCGNPTAIASLEPGETVLDLGSGGGFDCFLAAREVGPDGRVIGVDMTPEMVERARENVEKNDADTVEFRLGEIEHLPVADESVDAIISNCVINLSPRKPQVFREAFRVLVPADGSRSPTSFRPHRSPTTYGSTRRRSRPASPAPRPSTKSSRCSRTRGSSRSRSIRKPRARRSSVTGTTTATRASTSSRRRSKRENRGDRTTIGRAFIRIRTPLRRSL